MCFTRKRRAQFRRVILFYDDAGLSHSIMKFADLLPLVFENFPNAEIVVYNNDNNVASLYQPPPGRRLIAMPGFSSPGPGRQLRLDTEEATLTLRFRKSVDPTDIRDQVSGQTILFHTFGNQKYFEEEKMTLYLPPRHEVVHYCIPVQGVTIRQRQREILAAIGFEGIPQSPDGTVLEEEQFSQELREQLETYQRRYPELCRGRPIVLANILKKMGGYWMHDGESAHSIKARWLLALEKIVADMAVTLIINEGPQEWRCQATQRYPANWRCAEAPTWHLRTAHAEIVSVYEHLGSLVNARAVLLRLAGEPINVVRLAALFHLTKKSGGALLDVQTGSSHLAEWMQTPEVLEQSHLIGELTGSRPNLKRVLTPYFELNRDAAGRVVACRGVATHAERMEFARNVVAALQTLM
jgi:hypothetical protein